MTTKPQQRYHDQRFKSVYDFNAYRFSNPKTYFNFSNELTRPPRERYS